MGMSKVSLPGRQQDAGQSHDTVSERLRRWTRNPLGSARRGSNPLGVVLLLFLLLPMLLLLLLLSVISEAKLFHEFIIMA